MIRQLKFKQYSRIRSIYERVNKRSCTNKRSNSFLLPQLRKSFYVTTFKKSVIQPAPKRNKQKDLPWPFCAFSNLVLKLIVWHPLHFTRIFVRKISTKWNKNRKFWFLKKIWTQTFVWKLGTDACLKLRDFRNNEGLSSEELQHVDFSCGKVQTLPFHFTLYKMRHLSTAYSSLQFMTRSQRLILHIIKHSLNR